MSAVTGLRDDGRYGREDGVACLWLHVEPRTPDGSPRAFGLGRWYEQLCRAVDVARALAGYLAEDLGLRTRNDLSARVGILLQAPASMDSLVNTWRLRPLPGAVLSALRTPIAITA